MTVYLDEGFAFLERATGATPPVPDIYTCSFTQKWNLGRIPKKKETKG
jgi:hypothetical protein